MKLSRNIRACVIAALIAGALSFASFGVNRVIAQNAGQVLTQMVGTELIQLTPANTAAIAYTSTSAMRDGRFYLYNVPLTGFTITMNVNQSAVSLNPAGTLATGTIVLPPTVIDGKYVTIFSSAAITGLTISTSNGATFAPAVVTTIAANGSVEYVYDLPNNQWHRLQ